MATINCFKDLEIWQLSRVMSLDVFHLTKIAPFSNDFGLVDQIHRSSGSVMDNIAVDLKEKGNINFFNSYLLPKDQQVNVDLRFTGPKIGNIYQTMSLKPLKASCLLLASK